MLSGRWRTLLVYYLVDGKKRFAQLRRDNPKISHRMLTHELRVLSRALSFLGGLRMWSTS